MNTEIKKADRITDNELAKATGGYVIINDVGCYELYDEQDKYLGTFRGDQLQQLRKYARLHGVSDEIRMPGDPD